MQDPACTTEATMPGHPNLTIGTPFLPGSAQYYGQLPSLQQRAKLFGWRVPKRKFRESADDAKVGPAPEQHGSRLAGVIGAGIRFVRKLGDADESI
jgi:hypothetical protein